MSTINRFLRDEKSGLYTMVFLTNLGWAITFPLLPEIRAEFDLAAAQVALVSSAYGFSRLLLNLPIGLILDRVDHRLLRIIGALFLFAGSILSATAPTFLRLIVGHLVSGVGGATILVMNMVWISRLSTPKQRGWDLGVYQAVFQAGVSFSPAIAGLLATWGSWRTAFWFAAFAPLLAFVPMFGWRSDWINKVQHGPPQAKKHKIDPAKANDPRQAATALFVANLVTFVLFFMASGFQGTLFPLYGGIVLTLSTGTIGLVLGLSTVVRFGLSLLGGHLSDRFGRRVVLIPGLLIMGVGMLLLNIAANLTFYWLVIMVFSLGRFGNNVPATVLADHASPERWGFLMALNRLLGDLGIVLGPVIMGLLLQEYGYSMAVLVAAGIVWTSALTVILGVSEVQQRQPVMAWVRQRFRFW